LQSRTHEFSIFLQRREFALHTSLDKFSTSVGVPIFASSVNFGFTIAIACGLVIALAVAVNVVLRRNTRNSERAGREPRDKPDKRDQPASAHHRRLVVTTAGGTHIGGRENNEDAFLIKGNLVVLADGMGGQGYGEVASGAMVASFNKIDPASPSWLSDGILRGNNRMAALLAADAKYEKFGTTVLAARHTENELELGSSGDSHFFRLRRGKLEKLTEEHDLALELVRRGHLTPEQAKVSPLRNKLYRFIGGKPKPEWDTLKFQMLPGDVYLLCTDGLTDYSSLKRVREILASGQTAEQMVQELISMALADNTRDNATAVVMLVG
jgi:serine/threonine protein phosphatase PrpC